MARYRKEQGALNPTSGLGIIDNILNKFSNNAISNKAASEEFERINSNLIELKENGAMPTLDFANPLYTFDNTHTSYTANKDCYLCGILNNFNTHTSIELTVDGTYVASMTGVDAGLLAIYISPIKITAGSVVSVTPAVANAMNIYDIKS